MSHKARIWGSPSGPPFSHSLTLQEQPILPYSPSTSFQAHCSTLVQVSWPLSEPLCPQSPPPPTRHSVTWPLPGMKYLHRGVHSFPIPFLVFNCLPPFLNSSCPSPPLVFAHAVPWH